MTYFEVNEFAALVSAFDVQIQRAGQNDWVYYASQLVKNLEHGNTRILVAQLLDQAEIRNSRNIMNCPWEHRQFHYSLAPRITALKDRLQIAGIPDELVVAENRPFTAKAEVREFLEMGGTPMLLVDPYVGLGTLDCLRFVKVPIRLLTGTNAASIEEGFDRALTAFRNEGIEIDVRQHTKLHDRHVVFNDRCWLIGSSLKDAGKKAFHTIEIVDSKHDVIRALEAKWQEATPYP